MRLIFRLVLYLGWKNVQDLFRSGWGPRRVSHLWCHVVVLHSNHGIVLSHLNLFVLSHLDVSISYSINILIKLHVVLYIYEKWMLQGLYRRLHGRLSMLSQGLIWNMHRAIDRDGLPLRKVGGVELMISWQYSILAVGWVFTWLLSIRLEWWFDGSRLDIHS